MLLHLQKNPLLERDNSLRAEKDLPADNYPLDVLLFNFTEMCTHVR